MGASRRAFLGGAVSAAIALFASPVLQASLPQGHGQFPPSREPEPPLKPDPRPLLKAAQKDIKRDVRRLFELAEELKKEVEKTDSAEVLSLSLIKKAEEIEKLARHIKTLARG